jgi:hypothetical protein
MEYLQKIDTDVYEPGTIRADRASDGVTWTDARGRVRTVDRSVSFGANMEGALGANYGGKMAGALWEAAWKTAASAIPAGKTWGKAIAYTVAKIGVKSGATAGNYIMSGQYKADKALKKALLINAFTPTNYAPILNSALLEKTVVGKTFSSYYGFINGDGHSTNILQKNRLDYFENHKLHLHGTVYPINFLAQTETKKVGYGVYNTLFGNHKHVEAHADQIHNNDIMHMQTQMQTQGFDVVPNPASGLNVNLHAFEKWPGSAGEPKSGGGHDEGDYQGAFLPWSVEVTTALADRFANSLTEPMARAEAGISKDHDIWKNRIARADGVIDTGIEIAKGLPDALDRIDRQSLIYANRYFAVPILSFLSAGINEAVIAIDKAAVAVTDYSLAAAHIGYQKVSDALTIVSNAEARQSAPNPYDELEVIRDVKGKKISLYVAKVRKDETQVKQPVKVKLLIDAKANAQKAEENKRVFSALTSRLQAANIERQTGIKAGTMGNALPGQPFANNTPQMRNSVFGPINTNRSMTTVSQTKK